MKLNGEKFKRFSTSVKEKAAPIATQGVEYGKKGAYYAGEGAKKGAYLAGEGAKKAAPFVKKGFMAVFNAGGALAKQQRGRKRRGKKEPKDGFFNVTGLMMDSSEFGTSIFEEKKGRRKNQEWW